MAVAITITPESGSVIATVSACRINVTGASSNDASTYNVSDVPTEDPIPYRLVALKSGIDSLVSHEFNVSQDGKHQWDDVIFPDDGTWTVRLVDQRDDSIDATLSVVVTT